MVEAVVDEALDEQRRSQLIGLFTYLRELSRLRHRPVLDLSEYEQIIRLVDLRGLEGCTTESDDPELGCWLEVRRVRPEDPPTTPTALEPWLDDVELGDWESPPEIRTEIVLPVERVLDSGDRSVAEETVSLDSEPSVQSAYSEYLDNWFDWAERRRSIQPSLDAYSDLFRASQRAETLGEQYEVVFADGLLAWQVNGRAVRRHLATIHASIEYDKSSGAIRVGHADMSGAAGPVLEQEMIPPDHQPSPEVISSVEVLLAEAGSPTDQSAQRAIEEWVLGASPDGRFIVDYEGSLGAGPAPVATSDPMVIIRRRTFRSLERTYQSIISELEDGVGLPDVVVDLIEATDGKIANDSAWQGAPSPPPAGITALFPLPANDQQLRIVEDLQSRRHVVVQGPPGTGKSHTIANLISHALATGQRVLVTSHTERALRVLQDKLPDEIRNLTVSVVGSGKEGAKDLQRSASTLLSRMNDPAWSSDRLDDQIEAIERQLADLQAQRGKVLAQLARERAALTGSHDLGSGYSGTPGEIAKVLSEQRNELGWIPDEIQGSMPISVDEIYELRALAHELRGKREVHWAVDPGLLPEPEVLAGASRDLAAAESLLEDLNPHRLSPSALMEVDRAPLREALERYHRSRTSAERRMEGWVPEAIGDIDNGRVRQWTYLLELTTEMLDRDRLHEYSAIQASASRDQPWANHSQAVRALVSYLEGGGKLKQLFGTPKAVKEAESAIDFLRSYGVLISDLGEARLANDLIDELKELDAVEASWGDFLPPARATLGQRRAELQEHLTALSQVIQIASARDELSALAYTLLGEPVETHADAVAVAELVELADATEGCARARSTWSRLSSEVAQAYAAADSTDRRRIETVLESKDIDGYRVELRKSEDAFHLKAKWDRSRDLFARLDAASPHVASRAVSDPSATWIEHLPQAWNWGWATTELLGFEAEVLSELDAELRGLDRQIAELVADLATTRAWSLALSRLTPRQAQDLKAYGATLRSLGKGTGKQAATLRAEAQRLLHRCQSAVPAWIMPTYRVAETVEPEAGSFDLVIVDEASQSGPDAMFLFWIAKQSVIVGDDLQISPSEVGTNLDAVEALRSRHLKDVDLSHLLGTKQSLFDQAAVRFHGDIWLTEHFRCMPEIIEFSNRLMYAPRNRRLQTLRQFGSDRLPPLKRVYVPGGEREGGSSNAVNRAEARAIVDAVVECHGDPAYEGATFAVISLLGETQARLIEQELLNRLDPEAWMSRALRCGDAYDFQGDERDIVFMSMVATVKDGQARIPKLGLFAYEQRFNVAASRARDQAWLFHSMTIDELHPECVRHSLLNHFTQPPVLDVDPLTEVAPDDRLVRPFESLFEQRVFNQIIARGYAVQPQFEAYGRRIDLVVAGAGGKLAVECDGSHWHGPEQFAADLERQQALERAGWTFFRVSDIDFYLDPEEALEPLWQVLSDANIYPIGMANPSIPESLEFDVSDATAEIVLPRPSGVVPPKSLGDRGEPPPSRTATPATHQSGEPGTAHRHGGLAPYEAWKPRPISNPNMVSSRVLAKALVDFVSVEGPVVVERAFQELNSAAGNERLGKNLRSAFVYALREATSNGDLIKSNPLDDRDILAATIALPGQVVTPRELGPRRSLDHVPPTEIAAAACDRSVTTAEGEERVRALLALYGLSRLTKGLEDRLTRCMALEPTDSAHPS